MTKAKADKRQPGADRKIGLSRQRVGGRYISAYSPEVGLAICEKIAEGETLKKICTVENGMCSRQTFHRWVVIYPELSRAYAAARELSAHALEEESIDMARAISSNPHATNTRIRSFEVAMNQLRWSAARRNPKVYSERGSVQVTVPIQINTGLDLGEGLAESTYDHPNIYTLESKNVIEGEEGVECKDMMQRETKPLVEPNPTGVRYDRRPGAWRAKMMAEARERADALGNAEEV